MDDPAPPKRRRGRPSKLTEASVAGLWKPTTELTPEVVAKVVGLIEAGALAQDAVLSLNVEETTYYAWLKRGEEDPDSPQGAFSKAIKSARARARISRVKTVLAAEKGWQAHAWWLERTDSDHWGRHFVTEQAPVEGGNIEVVVPGFKDEEK